MSKMGNIIPMRHTYRNQTQDPMASEAEPEPQAPPKPKSTALKTVALMVGGTLLGLVVGDVYRRITRNKAPSGGDGDGGDGVGPVSMMGAIPGAPSIMPMPIPFPTPMPMQMPMMPNYGAQGPSFSDADRSELNDLRIKQARAEVAAEVAAERMRAWEEGDED